MDTYTLTIVVAGIILVAFLMALARMGNGTTVVVVRDGGANTGGGQGSVGAGCFSSSSRLWRCWPAAERNVTCLGQERLIDETILVLNYLPIAGTGQASLQGCHATRNH